MATPPSFLVLEYTIEVTSYEGLVWDLNKVVLGAKTQAEEEFRRSYRLKDDPVRLFRDPESDERSRLTATIVELREKQGQGEDNLIIRNFCVV
ncbi:unnamed protein product [Echinostoma caproni]|uniref:PX domain-containing protein n=1 Tax=Echinostoma caproni TaxID=27848 RepID=A0A183ATD8_9TREM|nr:unnamed protein product [Echinostoma caproni]